MRILLLVAATLGMSVALVAQTPSDSLVGTWRLVSQQSSDGGSEFGPNPIGQLMYDSAGNMSVQLLRADRPRFASGDRRSGTIEEVRAAFDGAMTYFGTYSVDHTERSITHHLLGSSFPNWIGTDQKRYYSLEGRRLILTSAPILVGGRTITSTLTWERLN